MLFRYLKSMSLEDLPIAGAFDFEPAFPSVIHEWIWLVLQHRKMLPDYIRVFQSLYKNATASFEHNGVSHVFIHFLSGVLQGCPASAFLFNNAIDPFLASFDNILRNKHAGIVRTCADNIGSISNLYIPYSMIAKPMLV